MPRPQKNKPTRVVLLLIVLAVCGYGCWRLFGPQISASVGLNYHAGKIQASNNTASSSSTTSSADSIFSVRRVAILQGNSHLVLDQVVRKLGDELVALPYVDEVDVFAPGEMPEPGERLYDAYLTVSIDVIKDSRPFLERDFKATVHFSAGLLPYWSRSGYTDEQSPPLMRYELEGNIEHASQSTEVGASHKLIIDNLAESLAGQFTENFTKWHDEYGADIHWPQGLMGTYPQDLAIPWPDGVSLGQVVDGDGLMRHREAMWATETDDPGSLVQAFHEVYAEADWRFEQGAVLEVDEPHQRYHFRAWGGSRYGIAVFEVRDGYGERKPGEVSRVCVRYLHRFEISETRRVIDQLLAEGKDLKVLGCLTSKMDSKQKDRYYQMLAERDPADPKALIGLAQYRHGQGRIEDARRYLICAYVNAHRASDYSKMRAEVTKAAKKMEIEDVADPPMTAESLAEFGYKSEDELIGSLSTIGINEPVLFFYPSKGEFHAVDLWIAPNPSGIGGVTLHEHKRSGGGFSSWSTEWGDRVEGNLDATRDFDSDNGLFKVHVRRRGDDELFEVEVVAASQSDRYEP